MFRTQFRVSRLRSVGGAAVVQVANINKGTNIQTHQSAMSLIVIDFSFLDGRIMKSWFKSWQLPTLTVIGSRHVFKRPYGWEKVPV
jgi:hypothetical protein